MYYRINKKSRLYTQLKDIQARMKAANNAAYKLTKELGFEQWRGESNMTIAGGIISLYAEKKPEGYAYITFNLKIMKRLVLLLSLILGACSDYEESTTLTHVNAMVLNRRTWSQVIGKAGYTVAHYQVYLFNGVDSKWYETDEETYRKLRPRDTIASYVLTITKTIKKE